MTCQTSGAPINDDELDALLRRTRPEAPGISTASDALILAAALPKPARRRIWLIAPGLAAVVAIAASGPLAGSGRQPEHQPVQMAAGLILDSRRRHSTVREQTPSASASASVSASATPKPPPNAPRPRRPEVRPLRRAPAPRVEAQVAARPAAVESDPPARRLRGAPMAEDRIITPQSADIAPQLVYMLPVVLEEPAGPYAVVTVRRAAPNSDATFAGGIAFARDDKGRMRSVELVTDTADHPTGTAVVETLSACSPTDDCNPPADAEPAAADDDPEQSANDL